MPDREKVIRGLECCISIIEGERCPKECPYLQDVCGGVDMVMTDALALLRGQTGQWIWDRPHHFRCSGCNGVVGQRTYLYCPNCGREMLLSETERRKEWPVEVRGND